MSEINRLILLQNGIIRGVSLNDKTLVVNNLKLKLGSSNYAATFSGSLNKNITITLPQDDLDFDDLATKDYVDEQIESLNISSSSSDKLVEQKVAGENITSNTPVYISYGEPLDPKRIQNRVYKLNPNHNYRRGLYGIATETKNAGQNISILYKGNLTLPNSLINLSSFIPGEDVYYNGTQYGHFKNLNGFFCYIGKAINNNTVYVEGLKLSDEEFVYQKIYTSISPIPSESLVDIHDYTSLKDNEIEVLSKLEYKSEGLKSDSNSIISFLQNSFGISSFSSAVYQTIRLSDGYLIMGEFLNFNGSPYSYLVKVKNDLTIDFEFNENFHSHFKNSDLYNVFLMGVTVLNDGKILAYGSFENYNDISNLNSIFCLNADGTLNQSFNNNLINKFSNSSLIHHVLQLSNGKILVVGSFTYNSSPNNIKNAVCLTSTGALDNSFDHSFFYTSSSLSGYFKKAVEVPSENSIFIVGNFSFLDSNTDLNYNLVKIGLDGVLDENYLISDAFNNEILDIHYNSNNNKIYLGGHFTDFGGTANLNYFVVLNVNSPTIDFTISNNVAGGAKISGAVKSIFTTSNKLFIGGFFTQYNSNLQPLFLAFDSSGNLDSSFVGNLNFALIGQPFDFVNDIALDTDNNLIISGFFYNYDNTGLHNVLKLNASNGTYFSNFKFSDYASRLKYLKGGPIEITAISYLSNGHVIVGCKLPYDEYDGFVGRNYILKFDSNGYIDYSFVNNSTDYKFPTNQNYTITKIVEQPDGKILIAGNFDYDPVNETNLYNLIRLNSDGTPDTNFNNNIKGKMSILSAIFDIALDSSGKIIICGNFNNYGGVTGRNGFVRLNSDGTVDTAFCSAAVDGKIPASSFINNVFVDSNDNIVICGNFSSTSYESYTVRHIVGILQNGSSNSSFNNYINTNLSIYTNTSINEQSLHVKKEYYNTFINFNYYSMTNSKFENIQLTYNENTSTISSHLNGNEIFDGEAKINCSKNKYINQIGYNVNFLAFREPLYRFDQTFYNQHNPNTLPEKYSIVNSFVEILWPKRIGGYEYLFSSYSEVKTLDFKYANNVEDKLLVDVIAGGGLGEKPVILPKNDLVLSYSYFNVKFLNFAGLCPILKIYCFSAPTIKNNFFANRLIIKNNSVNYIENSNPPSLGLVSNFETGYKNSLNLLSNLSLASYFQLQNDSSVGALSTQAKIILKIKNKKAKQ